MQTDLFAAAQACLLIRDPDAKARATREVAVRWRQSDYSLENSIAPLPIGVPGRPETPHLVSPRALPRRSLGTAQGHAALIHSIVHIEFNAINLAWDAVYRFRDLPRAYFDDWVRVADEEAYHFTLMNAHLQSLGYRYGDFDAHNGLWEMTEKTAGDVLERMALVPRVMEARGLDVTPGIIDKLMEYGDEAGVAVLRIILRDEIGHVEIGSRWFVHMCQLRGLDPETTFARLFEQYMKKPARGYARGGLHREARLAAGFSARELDHLEGIDADAS